jgi:uncharacterized protein with GYD domain
MKGATVARFVTFFSYTPEAWARLLDNPGDRSGPVGATTAELGGRLKSIDYMFGERDGMALFEAPDSATAAAVALVVASSGAFRSISTHELVASSELVDILRKAAAARPWVRASWGLSHADLLQTDGPDNPSETREASIMIQR